MAKKLEITITLKSVDKTLYSSVTIQMKPFFLFLRILLQGNLFVFLFGHTTTTLYWGEGHHKPKVHLFRRNLAVLMLEALKSPV